MDPDVAFFAGIIAAAVWQRDHLGAVKVHEGVANIVDGAMVMTYPMLDGRKINVTVDLA